MNHTGVCRAAPGYAWVSWKNNTWLGNLNNYRLRIFLFRIIYKNVFLYVNTDIHGQNTVFFVYLMLHLANVGSMLLHPVEYVVLTFYGFQKLQALSWFPIFVIDLNCLCRCGWFPVPAWELRPPSGESCFISGISSQQCLITIYLSILSLTK